MSYQKDYYATLQVNRSATQDEIERAYKRLSEAYHPDSSQKRRAAQRHAEVQEAYETLKDPRKRRQYDRQLAGARSAAGGMAPSDVLTNRFLLLSGGIIVASIATILVLVVVLGGGDGGEEVINVSGTPTPTSGVPDTPPDITAPFTTTASGLQIATIQEGTGATPQLHEIVEVNYTGWIQDGKKFDSSLDRGQTFKFVLGEQRVIKAWDEAVATMKIGGVYRIIAPPDLAYGEGGSPPVIPANATLIFDISVISTGTQTPSPSPTPAATTAATPTP